MAWYKPWTWFKKESPDTEAVEAAIDRLLVSIPEPVPEIIPIEYITEYEPVKLEYHKVWSKRQANGTIRKTGIYSMSPLTMKSNGITSDIVPNWDGDKVTGTPYECIVSGTKLYIVDKVNGKKGTIELLDTTEEECGVIIGNYSISFSHLLPIGLSNFEASFKIDGDLEWVCRAFDDEGEIEVESELKDGILTERLTEIRDKVTRELREQVGNIQIDPTTYTLGASTDDADERTDTGTVTTNLTYLRFESSTLSYQQFFGGARWTGALPAKGSTINACYAQVYNYSATYDDVNGTLCFQNAAGGATFTAGAGTFDISGRARTSGVSWIADGIGSGSYVNSPSLVTPMQEIVTAYTLTSVVLIFVPNTDALKQCRPYSWDQSGNNKGPQLYIDWTEGGAWAGTVFKVANPAKVFKVAVANISKVFGVSSS